MFFKKFYENSDYYANDKAKFNVNWALKKIISLLKTKDNVKHLNCVFCI